MACRHGRGTASVLYFGDRVRVESKLPNTADVGVPDLATHSLSQPSLALPTALHILRERDNARCSAVLVWECA